MTVLEVLKMARTMLKGYADYDDQIGLHEDAEYARARIAEIDAAINAESEAA